MNDAHDTSPEVAPLPLADAVGSLPTGAATSFHAQFVDETVPPVPRDPWAHRRGEPRVFALLWTVFLLIATMGMLGQVVAGGVLSFDVYRPAARVLLVVSMIGVGVLWPMTRLSQSRPAEGGLAAARRDIAVILLPLQAIIWPQHWLAAWAWWPLAALAAAMVAWVLLIGGGLALALQGLFPRGEHVPRQEGRRTAWMLGTLVLAFGTLPLRLLEVEDMTTAMGLWSDLIGVLSPVGAVLELSHDRAWSGNAIAVSSGHWAGIGVVLAAAAALWLLAWGSRGADPAPGVTE